MLRLDAARDFLFDKRFDIRLRCAYARLILLSVDVIGSDVIPGAHHKPAVNGNRSPWRMRENVAYRDGEF